MISIRYMEGNKMNRRRSEALEDEVAPPSETIAIGAFKDAAWIPPLLFKPQPTLRGCVGS